MQAHDIRNSNASPRRPLARSPGSQPGKERSILSGDTQAPFVQWLGRQVFNLVTGDQYSYGVPKYTLRQ